MSWTSKTATVAALAAGILVLYAVLSPPAGTPLAFADVAGKLRAAQTLSYDTTVSSVDGKTLFKSRNFYIVPGKIRSEMANANDEGFAVMDFPAGQALIVSTKAKIAWVSPLKGKAGHDMASKMIDDIRSLDEKAARSLGEKEIDGVRVKGFETDSAIRKTMVWANAETGDAVRIEVLQKNAPGGPTKVVMTNFKLDAQLDPSLFSVEPPQGYKIMPFMALDLNATPADRVSGLLKIYARHMDGDFPARLQDAVKAVAEKLKPKADEVPSEDLMQLSSYGAGVATVTMLTREGEDWQYYPGVKLGQKDRIVFWYRDRKTKTYQAVYGDLRIEKVDKNQLPPKPDDGPSK